MSASPGNANAKTVSPFVSKSRNLTWEFIVTTFDGASLESTIVALPSFPAGSFRSQRSR